MESDGADGNGDLSLTNSGLIEGGEGGSAVVLTGGATNQIINDGSTPGRDAIIRTKGGIADTAIKGGDGDDAIINRNGGQHIGSIDLGGGANSLTNEKDSTIISGKLIHLGNGNTFTNNGTFSPGGAGTSMSDDNDNEKTTVVGNYVQGSTGELLVDLDFQNGGGASDRADTVHITGTAHLDGLLTLNPATGAGKPGTFVLPVFTAGGGITGPGLTLNPYFDSGTKSTTPIFRPSSYTDGPTQYIEYTIDYNPDGLTPNASNVGGTVNDI